MRLKWLFISMSVCLAVLMLEGTDGFGGINTKDSDGDGPIHRAIWDNNIHRLNDLLDHHADIRLRDACGRTPLICAALHNRFDMVRLLLERGANPHDKDDSGETALHWAGMNGSYESAVLLLNAGARVNEVNMHGDRPLNHAADFRKTALIALYVQHGADPNLRNFLGDSILSVVADHGSPDQAKILIDKGATMPLEEFNECLRCLAWHQKDGTMLTLMAAYAVRLYGEQVNLQAPLYKAIVFIREVEPVEALIRLGADVDPALQKLKDEYDITIIKDPSHDPSALALSIVEPAKKALAARDFRESVQSFIDYDLENILLIGIHIVFILVPTLYLCFFVSWRYIFFPGVFYAFIILFFMVASSGPSASGDIQGMEIALIIFGGDALLMIVMPIMAICHFKARKKAVQHR